MLCTHCVHCTLAALTTKSKNHSISFLQKIAWCGEYSILVLRAAHATPRLVALVRSQAHSRLQPSIRQWT